MMTNSYKGRHPSPLLLVLSRLRMNDEPWPHGSILSSFVLSPHEQGTTIVFPRIASPNQSKGKSKCTSEYKKKVVQILLQQSRTVTTPTPKPRGMLSLSSSAHRTLTPSPHHRITSPSPGSLSRR